MLTLEAFQARISPNQLDVLSAADAGAVIGGTYYHYPKKSDKSDKSGKSGKSNKSSKSNKRKKKYYCHY